MFPSDDDDHIDIEHHFVVEGVSKLHTGSVLDRKFANAFKMRVFRTLKIVDSTLDIQAFVDCKGIRDMFLNKYCILVYLNPRTIEPYLTSLQHF